VSYNWRAIWAFDVDTMEVVLPTPTEARCHAYRPERPVAEWFCRGRIEYVKDANDFYGTFCLDCGEVCPFRDNVEEHCPACDKGFHGRDIEQRLWHMYGARHFSRKIGIYNIMMDRTTTYRCPFCKHEWSRGDIA
jgi:hypothetical protein